MKRFNRPLWLFSGIACLLLYSGCSSSDGANSTEEPTLQTPTVATRMVRVQTLQLRPTTFTDMVALTGVVSAPEDARLSAQTAGTVLELLPLGSHVKKGEAVAQLDPTLTAALVKQARAQLETAKAQANLAEDTYNRQKPLYQDSIISALEFENVRSQFNQAKAGLNRAEAAESQAEEQMKYTRVTAPFEGTVEERFTEEGEQVSPGMPIARIVNTRHVKVAAGVPERYASDIKAGSPVEIGFNVYGAADRRGKVSFVGRVINPENRTFLIEVELDNADDSLKPEMIATVFVTRATLKNQLVVPQTAVLHNENGTTMYVVAHNGDIPTATLRAVELGPSYSGKVVVTKGLKTGDEVLIVGQSNVTEGDALEIVSASTEEVQ